MINEKRGSIIMKEKGGMNKTMKKGDDEGGWKEVEDGTNRGREKRMESD